MTAEPATASPCIGICKLDDAGALCIGCQRSPAEIGAWPRADEDERRQILERVAARREALSEGTGSSSVGS